MKTSSWHVLEALFGLVITNGILPNTQTHQVNPNRQTKELTGNKMYGSVVYVVGAWFQLFNQHWHPIKTPLLAGEIRWQPRTKRTS
jgi:hypothetical protein